MSPPSSKGWADVSLYSELQQAAKKRWESGSSKKTRVVVQVAHCSQAVGAGEVEDRLRDAIAGGSDAELVVAGCDGACFAAPQVIVTRPSGETRRFSHVDAGDLPGVLESLADPAAQQAVTQDSDDNDLDSFFSAQSRLLLNRCGRIDPTNIDEYITSGGYQSLSGSLDRKPQEVIEHVLEAGLLGRGGAYFPAARKWQAVRASGETQRYLVVNAEEGEPGIFKDRHLMEGNPHQLLEGMLIAAYAAGCTQGYLYINAEAQLSARRIASAIEQAREVGLLGSNILNSGFQFDVEVRRGAGGYVCGEETTLLNTIQGERREPRLRPPFPTDSGVFYQPTVINNVETLANVPVILDYRELGSDKGEIPPTVLYQMGDIASAQAFSELGLDSARGTKLICLSGAVRRPGLVEVPMGTNLKHVIHDIGGGPPEGRRVGVVAVGGPSSGVLPSTELETTLRPGMLHSSGIVMGAGGVTVMDDTVPVLDVVRRLAAYNAAESCGKCTPCREGTPRMVEALDQLAIDGGSLGDLEELGYLVEIVETASLCGLGQMSGGPIKSAMHFFGDELKGMVPSP